MYANKETRLLVTYIGGWFVIQQCLSRNWPIWPDSTPLTCLYVIGKRLCLSVVLSLAWISSVSVQVWLWQIVVLYFLMLTANLLFCDNVCHVVKMLLLLTCTFTAMTSSVVLLCHVIVQVYIELTRGCVKNVKNCLNTRAGSDWLIDWAVFYVPSNTV